MKTLLFLLIPSAMFGAACPATITGSTQCLQFNSNNDATGTPHTTFGAAFSTNVTAGSALMFMHGYSGTVLTPSISDTLGNTFTCNTEVTNAQPVAAQFCYTLGIVTGGADTITANYLTPVAFNFAIVEEVTNIASFDVLITGTATYTTTATSTAFTTTAANDAVVVGIYVGTTLSGAGSGYTIRANGTTSGYGNEDGVVATAGSNTASFAITGSGGGVIVGGSFKVTVAVAHGASLMLSQ